MAILITINPTTTGSISGEVDPKDPKNAVIQDLALAPVNARGMVEYSAEFVLLKPKDMSKAGGVLRYDAPNRGNILAIPVDLGLTEDGRIAALDVDGDAAAEGEPARAPEPSPPPVVPGGRRC